MIRVGVKPHQLGASIDELLRAWLEAEDAGFESVWVFDHVYRSPNGTSLEALSLLSAMAAVTKRIRIGVLVLNCSLRHPALVASAAATIDQISGGRLELGLGAGSNFGIQDYIAQFGRETSLKNRMDLLEESCEIITRLWIGETLDFESEHFQIKAARLSIEPVQGDPPLIVGGTGQRSLRIVAKHAREWNQSRPTLDEFRERSRVLDGILEGSRKVARSVQVPLRAFPDKTASMVVEEFAEAGADRVVLMLDPPYPAGTVTKLGREVFG